MTGVMTDFGLVDYAVDPQGFSCVSEINRCAYYAFRRFGRIKRVKITPLLLSYLQMGARKANA